MIADILPCDDISWCELVFSDGQEGIREFLWIGEIIRRGRILPMPETFYGVYGSRRLVRGVVDDLRSFFVGIGDEEITFSGVTRCVGIVPIVIDVLLLRPCYERPS